MTALQTNERLDEVISILQERIVLGRLPAGAPADRGRPRRALQGQAARAARCVHRTRADRPDRRRRNRGVTVRQLTPDDVHQIYAVREILERAATRSIELPLPAAALAPIEEAQRRHDDAVAAASAQDVFRANFEFHDALFAACGNPYLAAAIEDFRKRTHVVWSYAIHQARVLPERARRTPHDAGRAAFRRP